MLQEGQQTQSMVPAFSWAAFFLNIACSLGHGRVQSETTTCQPFSMQTPAGLVSAVVSVCISKTKANTDTSRKVVGCAPVCQKPTDRVIVTRPKMEGHLY
ncbi:uncharacterized protein LOC119401432 isoform X5 [Rhipicephalus sanguineus]|uniref:uncharacterized protein LOC119401432 isoform X5 n=1 Tax=Rhipicephalus sanguineus TaxID=34632 RepID=UPI00189372C2|nr:uncharacterized protein LOC119401432 isoform X5 [Rhipicephalus sanguineus]